MLPLLLLLACGEPGFGGAVDEGADDAVAASEAPSKLPKTEPLPPKLTKLEIELQKARLDPARFPLIQLRVDVARLEMELDDLEDRGLTAARAVEPRLLAARALLADAERIALHRMNVCLARRGIKSEVKNYRMTAAGPVRLNTKEMMAQASVLDVDGCARIELLDQALVDRLKRAHEIRNRLQSENFSYHRVAERRALEDELKRLEAQLAREDVPVLTAPGTTDWGRR